jgi:hypothetical protein
MQDVADQSVAPTTIRADLCAIFISLELSRSTWLVTSLSPGGDEKMSKHSGASGGRARVRSRSFCQMARLMPAGRRAHWRRVALVVARMAGKRVGLDAATRMAEDARRQDDAHSRPRARPQPARRLHTCTRLPSWSRSCACQRAYNYRQPPTQSGKLVLARRWTRASPWAAIAR